MERVLALDHLLYDPKIPVVVMDEQPVQLFQETRDPIPATRHHTKRVDYAYDRAGVANIFMFAEPLGCWRRASVRERKQQTDWAHEVRILLEEDFPLAEKVCLVGDNLNIHSLGALYEALEPELAFSLAQRLETIEELRKAVEAWMKLCNENQKGVQWQFNSENARVKLHSLYPSIK